MVPNIQKNTLVQQEPTLIESKEPISPSGVRTKNPKSCCKSSSWQEISSEPYFNIGLIIDSTCIKDAHVSAINKPASGCQLTSLVVLHPNTHETNSTSSMKNSVGKWLKSNKVSADVEHLCFIGAGQEGCDKMLSSDSIHAVYIIVPCRYVGNLYIGNVEHVLCCV